MLGFREGNEDSYHQVRFDVSKAEPKLHLDYQVYFEKRPPMKIVSHLAIDYEDIWNFSENLAIGFLVASAYDINFDTMIIPRRLDGIKESFKNDPLSVYPLFVRSMAGRPFRLIKENPKAIEMLRKIATEKKVIGEKEIIIELENMGLLREGKLTILGDIVYARLSQALKHNAH